MPGYARDPNVGAGGTSIVSYQNDAPSSPTLGQIWVDADSNIIYADSNDYLSNLTASALYVSKVSASTTYLTQVSASSTYLTQVSASSTYLTQVSASSSYASTNSPVFTGILSASVVNVSTKLIAEQSMTIALSDEFTTLTTGTSKLTMRAPFAMTLTKIPRASINTVSTSGLPTVDINKNGVSIFSTTLSIDANEKTSVTAATPAVFAGGSASFVDDDEITFDIDVAGTGAKGLKITLYYRLT